MHNSEAIVRNKNTLITSLFYSVLDALKCNFP